MENVNNTTSGTSTNKYEKATNFVQLIGNLGRNPEVKELSNDNYLTKCSLATTEQYTDKAGKDVKNTTWHNLILWGKVAKLAGESLQKGNRIKVLGKLISNNYEDTKGQKRYETAIQVMEYQVIELKKTENDLPF